jgi:hypothetical protein
MIVITQRAWADRAGYWRIQLHKRVFRYRVGLDSHPPRPLPLTSISKQITKGGR